MNTKFTSWPLEKSIWNATPIQTTIPTTGIRGNWVWHIRSRAPTRSPRRNSLDAFDRRRMCPKSHPRRTYCIVMYSYVLFYTVLHYVATSKEQKQQRAIHKTNGRENEKTKRKQHTSWLIFLQLLLHYYTVYLLLFGGICVICVFNSSSYGTVNSYFG